MSDLEMEALNKNHDKPAGNDKHEVAGDIIAISSDKTDFIPRPKIHKANKTLTTKTVSEDIFSGIMFMHCVIRLLRLDTSNGAGKTVLTLTIVSMLVQCVVLVILLITVFLDFDNQNHRRKVKKLTRISTAFIALLAIIETTVTGVEAYMSGQASGNNPAT